MILQVSMLGQVPSNVPHGREHRPRKRPTKFAIRSPNQTVLGTKDVAVADVEEDPQPILIVQGMVRVQFLRWSRRFLLRQQLPHLIV